MSTQIKSKSELASMAANLDEIKNTLKEDSENLKSNLSNMENYDGIDVVGPGKILANNIDNVMSDLDTVSTNIKNYASAIIGFDIDDFNETTSSESESKLSYEDLFETDGSAEGNAQVIWNYFKYKGLSDAATAGILGNIQAESSFNPAAVEIGSGIGYGLIQWSFDRRTALEAAAQAQGVDPSDLQFQLEYLWKESVDPNSSYGKELSAAGFYDSNNPSDAAYLFHSIVEKSNDSYDAIKNNRCRTAEQWYNQLKGTSAGEVGEAIVSNKSASWANLATASTGASVVYASTSGGHNSSSGSYSYYSSSGSSNYVTPSFPRSTANRNVKIANVDYEKLEKYLEELDGKEVKLPDGLGSKHTYMGWQCITARSSDQYKLIESAGMNFDEQGFGKVGDRYVVATTTTFGNVGDYIDVVQEDGTIIKCIIGDIKSQKDANCTKWGHSNGHDVVEFVVDKSSWYGTNKSVTGYHPDWNKNIDSIINKGNYFDLAQKFPKTVNV